MLRRLRAGRGPLRSSAVRIVSNQDRAADAEPLRSPTGRYLYRVEGDLPTPHQPRRPAICAPRREVG
jgi:hypothetical protein